MLTIQCKNFQTGEINTLQISTTISFQTPRRPPEKLSSLTGPQFFHLIYHQIEMNRWIHKINDVAGRSWFIHRRRRISRRWLFSLVNFAFFSFFLNDTLHCRFVTIYSLCVFFHSCSVVVGGGENSGINTELWQACAGPLVNLPSPGTHVVYFPQGHSEQVSRHRKHDADDSLKK